MNKANQGMMEMKGYTDDSFQTPVTLQQQDNGQIEASVLGNHVGQVNIEEKQEQLEELKSFNFFSEAGKLVAQTVSSITQKIVDLISSLF